MNCDSLNTGSTTSSSKRNRSARKAYWNTANPNLLVQEYDNELVRELTYGMKLQSKGRDVEDDVATSDDENGPTPGELRSARTAALLLERKRRRASTVRTNTPVEGLVEGTDSDHERIPKRSAQRRLEFEEIPGGGATMEDLDEAIYQAPPPRAAAVGPVAPHLLQGAQIIVEARKKLDHLVPTQVVSGRQVKSLNELARVLKEWSVDKMLGRRNVASLIEEALNK